MRVVCKVNNCGEVLDESEYILHLQDAHPKEFEEDLHNPMNTAFQKILSAVYIKKRT